jgi:hypothetical protein
MTPVNNWSVVWLDEETEDQGCITSQIIETLPAPSAPVIEYSLSDAGKIPAGSYNMVVVALAP